jgi:hypothetical protein
MLKCTHPSELWDGVAGGPEMDISQEPAVDVGNVGGGGNAKYLGPSFICPIAGVGHGVPSDALS